MHHVLHVQTSNAFGLVRRKMRGNEQEVSGVAEIRGKQTEEGKSEKTGRKEQRQGLRNKECERRDKNDISKT